MRSPFNRFIEWLAQVMMGFAVGLIIMFLANIASKQAIKDECEIKLLYQQEQYRAMLKDTNKLYKTKLKNAEIAEVICVNTESMTAREMLWHMKEAFGDSEVCIGTQEARD